MLKQWVGCDAANFQKGRPGGFQPEAIVLHVCGGTLDDAAARFQDPRSAVSAHYAVGRDGSVRQFVEETDSAFHAGLDIGSTWTLLKPDVNPNFYTLGIEHEGKPGDTWTGQQCDASAALLSELAGRWRIPLDEQHVILHSEIRSSRDCPGSGCPRTELLRRASKLGIGGGPVPFNAEVRLTAAARVRLAEPRTSARIVEVLAAQTSVRVTGFTGAGERIDGNSAWYRTEEGNYLWAGATNQPQPVAPMAPKPVTAAALQDPSRLRCGTDRIDGMLLDASMPPVGAGDSDKSAIGAIQDLLSGQGCRGLPGIISPVYGEFGSKTAAAVRDFCAGHGLSAREAVDRDVLLKLVAEPAVDPRATQVYVTLALGFPYTSMHKVVCLVAQMEGMGRFGALNLNTDRAGLSFGIIQWAQRPGRLAELIAAFEAADATLFAQVFGAGDSELAQGLLKHLRKPGGGADSSGQTTDPAFNLVGEPWISRFRQAAVAVAFQQAQMQTALEAFNQSYKSICKAAPEAASERAAAFLLDVANQFGDGGVQQICRSVRYAGQTESQLIEAVADTTVERMPDKFKMGVRARRDMFLHSGILSDKPFTT